MSGCGHDHHPFGFIIWMAGGGVKPHLIYEIGGTPDIPIFIYKPIISNDLSPLSTGEPRPRRIFLPQESRSTVYFYAGDTITVRDAASHDRTSVIDALGRLASVSEIGWKRQPSWYETFAPRPWPPPAPSPALGLK